MDDEVGSLASMIAYYLQPMTHRGFSAYNLCLQESLDVCPSASSVVAGGSAGRSFGSDRVSVTAGSADSPESKWHEMLQYRLLLSGYLSALLMK